MNFGFKCTDDSLNMWLKNKKNKSKTIVKALTNEYQKELNESKKDKESHIKVEVFN